MVFTISNRFVYYVVAHYSELFYNPFMIYEYDDSIHFLKSTLQAKAKLNSSYSLRAFAKKLGLSAGGLSLVLNKKKKLSSERAHDIARALELKADEADYFMAMIQLEGAKSETLRMEYLDKLRKMNPKLNHSKNLKQTILPLEHFKLVSEWYGLAILELLSGVEGKWTSSAIQRKLKLSKIEVEVMLERLGRLEMIEECDGEYRRVVDTVMVSSHAPNEALRNYYEAIHDKSKQSIRTQSPEEKVIGWQVFAFDPTQLDEVRKLTDEYLTKLEELSLQGKNKSEVYQALTNVFRISNKENV
jgi:uncharacterized protein (TIGR02147 family)